MKTVCILVFSLVTSCSFLGNEESSTPATTIELGYSFGECIGYCQAQLVVQQGSQKLTLSSWNQEDSLRVFSDNLSSADWGRITSSISSETFCSMDASYGCPDCADGGAEWISMTCGSAQKRVVFEYGSNLPELRNVLEILRPLRSQLNPNE